MLRKVLLLVTLVSVSVARSGSLGAQQPTMQVALGSEQDEQGGYWTFLRFNDDGTMQCDPSWCVWWMEILDPNIRCCHS